MSFVNNKLREQSFFNKILPEIPVDSKKEVVEKLDRNLADGWEHDAILTAGRINDVTNNDVFNHGSDSLCEVFGFSKSEEAENRKKLQDKNKAVVEALKNKWLDNTVVEYTKSDKWLDYNNISKETAIKKFLDVNIKDEIKKYDKELIMKYAKKTIEYSNYVKVDIRGDDGWTV